MVIFLANLYLLSYYLFLVCYAANTIGKGESIRDGQTLISRDQNFELGFFSPSHSTKRYVGIWYYKITEKSTVVWVANRDNPVLDKSGVLTLTNDGDLMVLNGAGKSVWSTNTTIASRNGALILLDSGNLVLEKNEAEFDPSKALWQSFDFPTDTFLPGMKIGVSKTGLKKQIYTSWKSKNDPSTGNFSSGIDSWRSPQIVIWEGSKRLWRSGIWNQQIFTGVPSMRAQYLYGFRLIPSDEGDIYFTYSLPDASVYMRFQIQSDGTMEELRWSNDKKEWTVYWSQSIAGCDLFSKCGAYGSCTMLDSVNCNCLDGFVPKSDGDWKKGNWSSGCQRKNDLQCEKNGGQVGGDGFLELDEVKLPDLAQIKSQFNNKDDCENECLNNCSCKAYASVSGIGCLTWDQDLSDIQKFQAGGSQLYIRLNKSDIVDGKSNKRKLAILISVILGVVCLSIFAYLLWRNKNKPKDPCKRKRKETGSSDQLSKSKEMLRDFSGEDVGEGEENGPELPLFSFNTIETATNNFSVSNKLGHGGFGDVYKGTMPCGAIVAVKRLSRKSGQGLEEFKTEIILIAKLQHRNLVRILGCCIEEEEKMLVYEYMPNKSLDAFIFDPTKQVLLDWGKRFNIIEGIARGLLYLHRDSRLRIIHRDLKASNILLDDEMNPKISDFGMAKIFGGNQNQANTTRVVGTYGYMSPEYAMEGLFSIKSDVYSFGVLLLEIVSGKKNSYFRHTDKHPNLLVLAWNLWNEGKVMEFADPSISNSYTLSEVSRCMHVGILCVQDSAIDRPDMAAVVRMLESETALRPAPRPPTFTIGRRPSEMDLSMEEHEIVSTNDVTVTVILGR